MQITRAAGRRNLAGSIHSQSDFLCRDSALPIVSVIYHSTAPEQPEAMTGEEQPGVYLQVDTHFPKSFRIEVWASHNRKMHKIFLFTLTNRLQILKQLKCP